jgi:hypothetical protein
VGVNRADDHGVRLAAQAHIVLEPAASAEQARILEPFDGLADPELCHGARQPF